MGGVFWPIDRLITDLSFRIFSHAPSGQLVLVQFDPKSIEKLEMWPWPRTIHAKAIETILAAGASEIGYDVDFSSKSNDKADSALADALHSAGARVILPAFRQRAAADDDAIVTYQTTPLPMFVESAQIGSVSFRPATDGLIRTMSTIPAWTGSAVPAMSALLAGPAAVKRGVFHLDFGIDVAAIPRISLIDVLEGRIPPGFFQGKKVIVGAAATELGDQHAVPVWHRLHGIEIQALAYESIVQDRMLVLVRSGFIVLALVVVTILVASRLAPLHWMSGFSVAFSLAAVLTAFTVVLQGTQPVILPVGAIIVLIALIVAYGAYRDLWAYATLTFRQRMNVVHQRAFLNEVLEQSFDGIVVTNEDGIVVAHNSAARILLGLRVADISGQQFRSILPVDEIFSATEKNAQSQKTAADPHMVALYRIKRPGAKTEYLEIARGRFERSVSPDDPSERRTETRTFHTFTFRDVTERENRNIARAAEAQRAEEASRAKSEIMATMSHEFRTPLNAIIGYSQSMMLEMFGPLSQVYLKNAENIMESGRHLQALIDELFDVAFIESRQFVLREEDLDVSALVNRCMGIISSTPSADRRNFNVEISNGLPPYFADRRLLTQCILNIVTNSINYSRDGDTISVNVRHDAYRNLIIEIEDNGFGIDPDILEHIRKPFFRGGNAEIANPEMRNLGLGVALVDAYVKAHQGTLEISSKLGHGTVVRMVLPRARFVEVASVPGATPPGGLNIPDR